MISIDFEYYRPYSTDEAKHLFTELTLANKNPLFLNGGTEIITFMRIHALYTKTRAVIDIKNIPECTFIGHEKGMFVIGASVPLAIIEEIPHFPLLSKVCSRIADHTSREKITLGGNICGAIKYKEAILPLLLTNADLVIANKHGMQTIPIKELYNDAVGKIMLEPGAFLVQIKIKQQYGNMRFMSEKMTPFGRIGYPLITVSAIKMDDQLCFAFSGLCETPFQSMQIEHILNENRVPLEERITKAIYHLPTPILDDMNGSSAFREFILRNILRKIIIELGGKQ